MLRSLQTKGADVQRRDFLKHSMTAGAAMAGWSAIAVPHALAQEPKAVSSDPDRIAKAALKHFLPGKRTCAEAVLMAGTGALGVKSPLVPDIALGLAGGVGLQGRTCAAILGAAMVAGLAVGVREANYKKKKAATFQAAGEMLRAFEQKHGSTECRKLCGLDLTTPLGRARLVAGVKAKTCSRFVDTAARLMAEALAKK